MRCEGAVKSSSWNSGWGGGSGGALAHAPSPKHNSSDAQMRMTPPVPAPTALAPRHVAYAAARRRSARGLPCPECRLLEPSQHRPAILPFNAPRRDALGIAAREHVGEMRTVVDVLVALGLEQGARTRLEVRFVKIGQRKALAGIEPDLVRRGEQLPAGHELQDVAGEHGQHIRHRLYEGPWRFVLVHARRALAGQPVSLSRL